MWVYPLVSRAFKIKKGENVAKICYIGQRMGFVHNLLKLGDAIMLEKAASVNTLLASQSCVWAYIKNHYEAVLLARSLVFERFDE